MVNIPSNAIGWRTLGCLPECPAEPAVTPAFRVAGGIIAFLNEKARAEVPVVLNDR